MLIFLKNGFISNTLNRFKIFNFVTIRGLAPPDRLRGRVIVFWWPGVPLNQNPAYATDDLIKLQISLIAGVDSHPWASPDPQFKSCFEKYIIIFSVKFRLLQGFIDFTHLKIENFPSFLSLHGLVLK